MLIISHYALVVNKNPEKSAYGKRIAKTQKATTARRSSCFFILLKFNLFSLVANLSESSALSVMIEVIAEYEYTLDPSPNDTDDRAHAAQKNTESKHKNLNYTLCNVAKVEVVNSKETEEYTKVSRQSS